MSRVGAAILLALLAAVCWGTWKLLDAGCTCEVYGYRGSCASWSCPEEGEP